MYKKFLILPLFVLLMAIAACAPSITTYTFYSIQVTEASFCDLTDMNNITAESLWNFSIWKEGGDVFYSAAGAPGIKVSSDAKLVVTFITDQGYTSTTDNVYLVCQGELYKFDPPRQVSGIEAILRNFFTKEVESPN